MDHVTLEDLSRLGLAWARVVPTITLVPAFGLRALPRAARAFVGLALAASVAPAMTAHSGMSGTSPWAIRAVTEALIGLPVALAAAIPLWAATMAGGLLDNIRGASEGPGFVTVEDRPGALGVLFSLFASAMFLATGGPSRIAIALSATSTSAPPVLAAMRNIVGGISMAVSLGAPLLAAAVILELAFALVARAASPANVHTLLAPVRSLVLLAMAGLLFERIASLLAAFVQRVPS